MDKLYLHLRLVNGDERHLACKQPETMNSSGNRDDVGREELDAFINEADKFAAQWLPTAEGTWVARSHVVEVTPVRVDVDTPPWKWAVNDTSRVLPLSQ